MKQPLTMDRLLSEYGGLIRKYAKKDAATITDEYDDPKGKFEGLQGYLTYLFHYCLSSNEGLGKREVVEKNRQIYLAMARFAKDYTGEDPNLYVRLAFEAEMNYYRNLEEQRGEIYLAAIHAEEVSCDYGRELHQCCKPLKEIHREHPLAGERCERETGCVCSYRFTPCVSVQGESH